MAKECQTPKMSTHQVVKAMIHSFVLLDSYIVEANLRECTVRSKIDAQLLQGRLGQELIGFQGEILVV